MLKQEKKEKKFSGKMVRKKYLDFFSTTPRNHTVIPSASLAPENDPTTLFTGSGMQPLLQYFFGKKHPAGSRIVDSQKCFRAEDIEVVGDNRHMTFFEMLGNWSFGDYFKEEQLKWIFTFLVDVLQLPPERLYISVFRGNQDLNFKPDNKAVEIWQKLFDDKGITARDVRYDPQQGMQDGRIFYYSAKKNWWSRSGTPEKMPVGEPGGPSSEIFYDFGPEHKFHENSIYKDQKCHPNCDCGRFLEIGNSVFMQFKKTNQGFEPLKKKNIDFGGGLERIVAALNDEPDVFLTDLFMPIIEKIEDISSQKYSQVKQEKDFEKLAAFRVIADHMRGSVMCIGDGIKPSNKERGYFVRRLIRRSVRHGRFLGIDHNFVSKLVPTVARIFEDAYPEIGSKKKKIVGVIKAEEKKFRKTLNKGLDEFKSMVLEQKEKQKLTAEKAFQLYQTYGFPFEMSLAEAEKREIKVEDDIDQKFEQLKKEHAQKSRQLSAGKFKGGLKDSSEETTKYHTATHLLHQALKYVLGDHVEQKGSNITGKRLRFDFSHPKAVTDEEIEKIEALVNRWIAADYQVTNKILPKTEALETGSLALFADKYPDQVTVYTIGANISKKSVKKALKTIACQGQAKDYISREICRGPHIDSTGQIGAIEIYKEKSAGSGIRRIYARTQKDD